MKVIVGGIIEKDGKYLLVQEAKEKCYKKWNVPAGHLDCGEGLIDAAKREIKEETGCDVELTGVSYLMNKIYEDDLFVMIIFTTKLINENIEYDINEILDVKWFEYDDIMNNMNDKLRGIYIKRAIENYKKGVIAPIDIVDVT